MPRKIALASSTRTALAVLLLLTAAQARPAGGLEIPQAENFVETGQLSKQLGIPTIVFVSRDACPYCRTLRNTILNPMLRAGKFEQRAILVEVSLDRGERFTGYANERMTAKAFGAAYDAVITPTLLFLDAEGREISRRLIGISNLELYGFYLQESIDQALLGMHAAAPGS